MSIYCITYVWQTAKESGTPLLVLLALADWANDDGFAWPGMAALAKKCRITERNAQLILRKLEASDTIGTELQKAPHTTNRYFISGFPEWLKEVRKIQVSKGVKSSAQGVKSSVARGEIQCIEGVKSDSPDPSVEPSTNRQYFTPDGVPVSGTPEQPIASSQGKPSTSGENGTMEKSHSAAPPLGKKAPNSHAAMLDAFLAGAGKDMLPPGGVAYGPYMRLMTRLEADGYAPVAMRTAGLLYRAWWEACGRPIQTLKIGEMDGLIQSALQLVKMGKYPEEITALVTEALQTKFYRDNGIKLVKFETVAKLCRPTNFVRDAIADGTHPGLAEDPERPGVYMLPSELRALIEARKFTQYTGDQRAGAELP